MINSKLVDVNEESFSVLKSIINVIMILLFVVVMGIIFGVIIASDSFYNNISSLVSSSFVTLIVLIITIGFIFDFAYNYLSVKLYNLLLTRMDGIQFELTDDNKLAEVDIVSTASIITAISTIWAFVFGIILASTIYLLGSLVSTASILNEESSEIISILSSGAIPIGSLLFVVVFVLVSTFLTSVIMIVLYNVLAKHGHAMSLDITQKGDKLELKSIDLKSFVCSMGLAYAIFSIIVDTLGLILNFSLNSVMSLAINFISALVVCVIFVFFYNLISFKIGGIKFNLRPSNNVNDYQPNNNTFEVTNEN